MMMSSAKATGRAALLIDCATRYATSSRVLAWRTAISTSATSSMTMAPSTSRPKSIAPSDIRLPVTPSRTMPMQRDPHRQRDRQRGDQRAAEAPQREEQHHHHQHRPLGQVDGHGLQHAVDELGAVVVRADLDARRAAPSGSRRAAPSPPCTTSREFAPVSIITVPATISPSPCLVTAPKRSAGPIRTSPTLLDQHRRAVRVGGDDGVLDVLDAAGTARRRG